MNQQQFQKRLLDLGISPTKYSDFLPTCSGGNDSIQETEKYFFKPSGVHAFKEVRFYKKTGRTTVAGRHTSEKLILSQ